MTGYRICGQIIYNFVTVPLTETHHKSVVLNPGPKGCPACFPALPAIHTADYLGQVCSEGQNEKERRKTYRSVGLEDQG